MSSLLKLIALLLTLLAARPALAQEGAFDWTMPSAEEQLAGDRTEIPVGMGAVFVPSITGPTFEPPASLVSDQEIISVPIGQRVLVEPGPYVVIISSGSPAQGTSIAVDVVEGETTLVPVQWGALRIEVVDDRRTPHRGSYEIIRADTRQPIGTGFGADTLQGEILQTWLLTPGIYRIVRTGRNARALKDYATVVVPAAGFVRYRVVMDPDTGEFQGSGILLPDDFTTTSDRKSRWFRSMVVGIDGALVKNENVVGALNQTQYIAAAYLDSQFVFNAAPHRVTVLAQIDEGATLTVPQAEDPLPIAKTTDRLRGDLLYTMSLRGTFGPYTRASAESQAFPTELLASEDTVYLVTPLEGEAEYREVAANETLHISDPWFPTVLREGIGVNTTFLQKNRSMNFNWRVGYGLRQNLYGGTLNLDDIASTPEIEYTAIPNFFEQGIESTVIATLRLPGWVVYSTDLELFAPFTRLMDPAVSWRNTLSLRITRNLSLNYFANVDIEPQVDDELQVQQSLLLRTTWAIF